MRLILRRAAARLGEDGSVVVAASPDSLARQRWQWDVRLAREPLGQAQEYDGASVGRHFVCVRVDPSLVTAELVTACYDGLEAGRRTVTVERPVEELWLAIVETGTFGHGPFDVAPGDVLVWEGDDPVSIDITPSSNGPVTCALVSLRRTDGQPLRWVP